MLRGKENTLVDYRSHFVRVVAEHHVELLAQYVAVTERESEKSVNALEAMSEEMQIALCAGRGVDALLAPDQHARRTVVNLRT